MWWTDKQMMGKWSLCVSLLVQEMQKMYSKASYSYIQYMYESYSVEKTYCIFLFPAMLILQTLEESQTKIGKKIIRLIKASQVFLLTKRLKTFPKKSKNNSKNLISLVWKISKQLMDLNYPGSKPIFSLTIEIHSISRKYCLQNCNGIQTYLNYQQK